ncbi:hypothetical protein [Amycolatopsis antarctica]|nr:hypothetical protein [Amycolatopsis antarctica]
MLSDELGALEAEAFEVIDIEEPARMLAGTTVTSPSTCAVPTGGSNTENR